MSRERLATARRRAHGERGATIIENLVAISLISIAVIGSTSLFINSFEKNQSARNHGSIVPMVRLLLDQYRGDYGALLDIFGTGYTLIANGQQATTTLNHAESRSQFVMTLTAIKSRDGNPPEAVRVSISATQRGGARLGARESVYETIIAQTN